MALSSEMRLGDVYACEVCGLELEVVNESETPSDEEENDAASECTLFCCGDEMALKEDE